MIIGHNDTIAPISFPTQLQAEEDIINDFVSFDFFFKRKHEEMQQIIIIHLAWQRTERDVGKVS